MKLISLLLIIVLLFISIVTVQDMDKEFSGISQEAPNDTRWYHVAIWAIICGIATLPIITRFDR